jgi:hypothetical protein|tara:strand:+ start:240 stop:557 length:318 start_codon:yes stop_codon:yes gene_type:complete
MQIYLLLGISALLNGLLIWYIIKLLRKFVFISENLADLFLTTKAFQVFLSSMYSMENYHGEPMVQELITRVGDMGTELELFRDIFEHNLDTELEEELNAAAEEEA